MDIRWMTCTELWLSMGLPCTGEAQEAALATCHFDDADENYRTAPPSRTRHSQMVQCGNAMHVASIGS
eukprot:4048144-Pyramimonas_sp.AAC.1